MRRIMALVFTVMLCISFSSAFSEAPIAFSDIPLVLPDSVQTSVSIRNGYCVLQTNWAPRFSDAQAVVQFDDGRKIRLKEKGQGIFESDEKVNAITGQVLEYRFTSAYEETESKEQIYVDPKGNLVFAEILSEGASLSYQKGQDQQERYTYTVDQQDTPLPLVNYSVTYGGNGEVIEYRLGADQNMEITYNADGEVIEVDALVPYDDGSGDAYRIHWDFEGQFWYLPATSEVIDYPPYVPAVIPDDGPTDPEENPAGNQDPSNDADAHEQQQDPQQNQTGTDASATAPYIVKAPPLTVNELHVACTPSSLRHIPLGEKKKTQGLLKIQDQGYAGVTILSSTPVSMQLQNGYWVCQAPDDSCAIQLKDAAGLYSQYTPDGQVVTFYASDPSLSLQTDGSYAYDGTGRENVTACYSPSGDLVSYAYHNADSTKAVSYDPYGKVLFYTASSSDGSVYRYQNQVWEKQGTDGGWIRCLKPDDVNPSDLPPLLLLERAHSTTGTWYPNNTVGIIGVSLRDRFPALTQKWYHILPVDLTQQGTQSFKLVASNLFYIGRLYVTVHDDAVTVQYQYSDGLVFPKEDFFRWFTSMDEITHDFLEQPTDSLIYGKAYSISEDLQGASTAILFVCNRVTYRQPIWNDGTMLVRYWPNIQSVKEHRQKAEDMLDRMTVPLQQHE